MQENFVDGALCNKFFCGFGLTIKLTKSNQPQIFYMLGYKNYSNYCTGTNYFTGNYLIALFVRCLLPVVFTQRILDRNFKGK